MSGHLSSTDLLSRRERQIAAAYAGGASYKEVAEDLGIAPTTVRTHLGTIYRKLGISTKIALVRALEAVADGPASARPDTKGNDAPKDLADNVPRHRTRLIGRETSISEVTSLLCRDDVGLVTLTGPGGSGKTRLACEVAAGLTSRQRLRACYVELAPIREPTLVASKISQTFGLQSGDSPLETLKTYLRDRRLLLVLDNFEQILPAATDVADLLASCPDLKILVTSRASLQIRGEFEYPVPPLALPEDGMDAEVLHDCPSVQLLVERAASVRPEFGLDNTNAPILAEICARLDGLPLALELAAARFRLLDPKQLLERLQSRLPLLVGGARDLPDRQQTLRATIAWSHDLLDPAEQRLFEALSIFVGGADLAAIGEVCAKSAEEEIALLDNIESLVTKSLVRRSEGTDGAPRFLLLETLREFGLECLDDQSQRDALARRHAEYFQTLAERAERKLKGPEQASWLDRVEMDHGNFRAALSWCQSQTGDAELGLNIAAHMSWFWRMRGYIGEGTELLEGLLDICPRRTLIRAKALTGLTIMVGGYRDGDLPTIAKAEEAVSIARELKNNAATAWALHGLGRALGGPETIKGALAAQKESLKLFESENELVGCAYSGMHFGITLRDIGDLEGAERAIGRSIRDAERSGDPWMIASAILQAGTLALRRDDLELAAQHLRESLTKFHAFNARFGIWFPLVRLAAIACRRGHFARAAKLYGVESELRRSLGLESDYASRAAHERHRDETRSALGNERFDGAHDAGTQMSLDSGVSYAISSEDEGTTA